jgi:hypothetical protein
MKGAIMLKWFMLEGGQHHKVDEGIWLHYSNTCNIQDMPKGNIWANRLTDTGKLDPVPDSRVAGGCIEIRYETKGVLTFFAQIGPGRAAWQRIEWKPNLSADADWKADKEVRQAIEHFLWVAHCEEAKKILPKQWWL